MKSRRPASLRRREQAADDLERAILRAAIRIDDFDIHRPFGMRVLGYSMLHLRSSDPDLSTLIITGIPNLEALADQLRECSLKERTRRKITTFVKA